MAKLLLDILIRVTTGFSSGFILACFVLIFLGQLPPSNDLNYFEIEQQNRSLWLAFYLACGMALTTAVAGRLQISKFWLWFCVAFGILCIVPFWPSGSGLLPLGTPHVNFDFHASDAVLLIFHVGVAIVIAAIITASTCKDFFRRNRTPDR